MLFPKEWLAKFPIKEFKRGHIFSHQGDPFLSCYYITSGICARTIVDDSGTEIVMKYYFPGNLLGIWFCFRDILEEQPATFLSKTDGYAYEIPTQEIKRELNTNFAFYRMVTQQILNGDHYIETLYQKKAKGNAVEILCYTIRSLLQTNRQQELFLSKYFSHTELSLHLRLHRVTVSKIFASLQQKQVLQKQSYGWKILQYQLLSDYADGKKKLEY